MKLHLACGHRFIPGWVHVDLADMPHIDVQSPIDDLQWINDSTVDMIYISHGLCYLPPNQVHNAFDQWWRVLKPNGILRLSVPNLTAAWEVYQLTKDITTLYGALYGHMEITTATGKQIVQQHAQYDQSTLSKILTQHRFHHIESWDWRTTEHAQVDDYSQAYWPHMQKDTGILMSLNIQAKKFVR
jgi:predicted SAM-dependent methyltransferase